MKNNKMKLWIKSLWLYMWFQPFYKSQIQKEYDEVYDEETDEYISVLIGEYEEDRWYIKPRVVTWLLLFPAISIPLFIYGGVKMLVDYFKYIFTYYEKYITTLPKKVDFITKLDIVLALSQ